MSGVSMSLWLLKAHKTEMVGGLIARYTTGFCKLASSLSLEMHYLSL